MIFYTLIILCSAALLLSGCAKQEADIKPEFKNTRETQLSSSWYPQHPIQLKDDITQKILLSKTYFSTTTPQESVRALIVPHAGLLYSGLSAAAAYQSLCTLSPKGSVIKNKTIKRVILLSPAHHVFLQNVALAPFTHYETPLGDIEADHSALAKLALKDCFFKYPEAFKYEHGLEMQLIFLKSVLEDFKLVPLIVGKLNNENVVRIALGLRHIIDDQTLIVVSSDFTHYGPNFGYTFFTKDIVRKMRTIDSFSTQAIAYESLKALDTTIQNTQTNICGYEPIRILLALKDIQALSAPHVQVGLYYTSADMLNALQDKDRINIKKLLDTAPDNMAKNAVSYISMVLSNYQETFQRLNGYEKIMALKLARDAIANSFNAAEHLAPGQLLPLMSPGLDQNSGVFVSIYTHTGALRGCMGQLQSHNPTALVIHDMALAAAFKDNRFSPLTEKEFEKCIIKISILSPAQSIKSYDQIKLGEHGIIVYAQEEADDPVLSALFLPHVAVENKWSLEETLRQLAIKAGADPDLFKKYNYAVFTTQELGEA